MIGFARIEGDEPNLLAFGILVPMFGIGLNGLWASRHGTYGQRLERRRAPDTGGSPEVTPPDHEMEQNAPHG